MDHLYLDVRAFWQDEEGVTSLEYGMLGSLIAVVIMLAVSALGGQVCERFRNVALIFGATDVPACF